MRLRGFTLIELLVVLAIIAALMTLVSPNYFKGLDRAKETVLRQNLDETRHAIDKYYADKGQYPPSLQALADEHYLKQFPLDPVTERSDSWQLVSPPDGSDGVYDLHSGAGGRARDGTPYASW